MSSRNGAPLSSDSEGRTLFDEHGLRLGENVAELFRTAQKHQVLYGSLVFASAGEISWDPKDKNPKDPKAIAALEAAGLLSKENELLELQRGKLQRLEKELADLLAEDAKDEAKEKQDVADGFGSPLISTRATEAISKKAADVENIKEAVLKLEMAQMTRINGTNAKLAPYRVGDVDGCKASIMREDARCIHDGIFSVLKPSLKKIVNDLSKLEQPEPEAALPVLLACINSFRQTPTMTEADVLFKDLESVPKLPLTDPQWYAKKCTAVTESLRQMHYLSTSRSRTSTTWRCARCGTCRS